MPDRADSVQGDDESANNEERVMKNQYIGDIGDYGKYSLLLALSSEGINVGVNWYLTRDDGSNDGKYKDYLDKPDFRVYDPVVYDALKNVMMQNPRTVKDIQDHPLFSGILFYDEMIDMTGKQSERMSKRYAWFERSLAVFQEAQLIFMDPDNGLMTGDGAGRKIAEKYILPSEVEEYFNAGKNVVYYCHKGRRKQDAWQNYKNYMFDRIPKAKPLVLTFHKGTQRSYVFLLHDTSYDRYREVIERFLPRWNELFKEEQLG